MANLLKKLIFGLDISDFSIEALQLTSKEKLKAFGRVIIEEGIVKNGFILNKKKLVKKIKEVVSQAKIKARRVVLSLPESKIFIHIFRLPTNLKRDELRTAIESEVKKTIPLEISRIYWDYQIIFPQLLPKNNQQLILFVGTLKEIVDDYIEVLDEVGLEPVAFEIESAALKRALLKNLKTGAMIIDVGARTTNISIFDKEGILRESTTVPVAGNQFTKTIARKLKIPLEKAEKLKRNYGLNKKKEKGKVAAILEKELQPIIKKIKKSTEYYNQEIEKVFLVGGSARLPKIAKFLSLSLGFKVDVGISPLASQLGRKSVLFNTVIGLALRSLEKNPERAGINLLPKVARLKPSLVSKKTRKKKIFPYLGIGFGILALIFLGWVIYAFVLKPLSKEIPFLEETPLVKEEPSPGEIPEKQPVSEEEEEEPSSASASVETSADKKATEGKEEKIIKVIIQETETGWLNVREGSSTSYSILMKIYPGESYPLLDEFDNWYKIELIEGQEGWIATRYATISE